MENANWAISPMLLTLAYRLLKFAPAVVDKLEATMPVVVDRLEELVLRPRNSKFVDVRK